MAIRYGPYSMEGDMRARRNTPRLLLKRFAKCTHGSTAAEFAIAASVALALIFAIVDVGRAFIVNGLLSDAARQISRENQVRETPYSSGEFSSAAQVTIAQLYSSKIARAAANAFAS